MQTQIRRRHRTWRAASDQCLHCLLLNRIEQKCKSTSDTPKIGNRLVQLIRMDRSTMQMWVKEQYCTFPKYSDIKKICCNHSKIWTMWLYHRVMSANDADGMANSVDPDQTAPLGAIWSGSALFAQAYLSKNSGSLLYIYVSKQYRRNGEQGTYTLIRLLLQGTTSIRVNIVCQDLSDWIFRTIMVSGKALSETEKTEWKKIME